MLALQCGDYLPSIGWLEKAMPCTGCDVEKAVYGRVSFNKLLLIFIRDKVSSQSF